MPRSPPPCPIQMQQWSQQRARLEEEIIRRQEASRYASPSLHAQGALAGPSLGGQAKAEGYMSPYAGLVSHQVGRVERKKERKIERYALGHGVKKRCREGGVSGLV